MTKKKLICIILCVTLIAVLLIPIPIHYDDGGTVKYQAVLYSVTDYHKLNIQYDHQSGSYMGGHIVGIEVKILGITVYESLYEE